MNANQVIDLGNKNFMNAEDRAFAREELVYNVTEDLLVILEDAEISKKELARRLGKSPSFVTQVLSGSRNMTLGSLSDICFALGFKPEIKLPVQEPTIIVEKKKLTIEVWTTQAKNQNKLAGKVKPSNNVIYKREPILWGQAA